VDVNFAKIILISSSAFHFLAGQYLASIPFAPELKFVKPLDCFQRRLRRLAVTFQNPLYLKKIFCE